MSWTDERVETLRKLWGSGKSASDIAKILGGVTRNAVIGKAHRLGLSGKAKPARRPAMAAGAVPAAAPAPVAQTSQPCGAAKPARSVAASAATRTASGRSSAPLMGEEDRVVGATILDLTERMCKWPIGDPKDADFHFCGRPSQAGMPYCAEHAAKAYQPPQSRKSRDDERRARAS